jgi:uncharacterized protein YecE (DUF72 family)
MECYIGCSGFYYRHWRGLFYPDDLPQRLWFEYYCSHFNTVELNTTFYNFPKEAFLRSWHERSPADFLFTVKAPRLITHYKKFADCKTVCAEFYDVILKGLKEKTGTILFQLPPSMPRTEVKLSEILGCLSNEFSNVIEFRHQSWWTDQVYDELSKHDITFCGISHPTLPDKLIHNTEVLYYRMHGTPRLYASLYSRDNLESISAQIMATKAKKVFVYFNNDVNAYAVQNATALKELFKAY